MLKGKEQTERLREDETYVDHVRYLKGSGDSEQDEVTLPVGQLQVVDGDGPTGFDTPVQRPDLNSENGRSIQQQVHVFKYTAISCVKFIWTTYPRGPSLLK